MEFRNQSPLFEMQPKFAANLVHQQTAIGLRQPKLKQPPSSLWTQSLQETTCRESDPLRCSRCRLLRACCESHAGWVGGACRRSWGRQVKLEVAGKEKPASDVLELNALGYVYLLAASFCSRLRLR